MPVRELGRVCSGGRKVSLDFQFLELQLLIVSVRAGCIINISSLLGLKGGRGSMVYAASKAGVLGMLRKEPIALAIHSRIQA